MMQRIIDVDMMVRCKKVETAFNRFFKKYPELDYWREQLEWMAENNIDFDCNNVYGCDGSRNYDWTYALHLDICEDYCYIAVIERA